jgi:hypothetical protein
LRHTDRVEQCPFSEATRKIFARTEFCWEMESAAGYGQ